MADIGDLASELVGEVISSGDPLSAAVKLLIKGGITIAIFYLDRRACQQFLEEIQTLFVRLTKLQYLAPLIPASQQEARTARMGWMMTPAGVESLFMSVYTDISNARERFGHSAERLKSFGLQEPVVVNLNSPSKGSEIRKRLGATWPPQYRKWILQRVNPFQFMPTIAKKDLGRFALGMVRKSVRSPAHPDLLLARTLGLAQFCGLEEVSLADLIELMAHACHYERVARRYIAAVFGVHYTVFTGYALASSLDGKLLGSLENPIDNFAKIAEGFTGSLTQIGAVESGKPRIIGATDMPNIKFKIDSGVGPKQGEPIYMISGWAEVLRHRPKNHPHVRSMAKDLTVGLAKDVGKAFVPAPLLRKMSNLGRNVLARDVHGNNLYFSAELETITVSIKRTPGGRLVGKVSQFGDFRPSPFGGQGVFGVRCGCNKPEPGKIIQGSKLNGCPLMSVHKYRAGEKLFIGYDGTVFHWTAGDLPMILSWADSHVTGTYIQVAEECVYCATSRALGTGCNLIIAGGW
ncbi:conserved hypothetical protein [Talaromyces stipitatus ATCC 10500]|uniref:Uncharacterized protein n=1 Tax=Talaromyces stipitatus (strain ATCC 10500 / CBS 375.48 / QM 6759 / NRRL 1006) TaxID=441959 RepID=B8M3B3_TALSN|nr:uncharacterized protein TSTA_095340 [Talaromyces stipitatus ATCC 10500]EED22285.1 conserved hypothetical protein [Talaromyces stipitatus ATCC 10500]